MGMQLLLLLLKCLAANAKTRAATAMLPKSGFPRSIVAAEKHMLLNVPTKELTIIDVVPIICQLVREMIATATAATSILLRKTWTSSYFPCCC